MDAEDIRDRAVKIIDDYLAGKINNIDASKWALGVVKSCSMKKLPERISGAIYLILDLHDEGQDWCPSHEQLRQCREGLISDSGPSAYHEVKLKSKTTRALRKEIIRKTASSRRGKGRLN